MPDEPVEEGYVGESWTVAGVTVDELQASTLLVSATDDELRNVISSIKQDGVDPVAAVNALVLEKPDEGH